MDRNGMETREYKDALGNIVVYWRPTIFLYTTYQIPTQPLSILYNFLSIQRDHLFLLKLHAWWVWEVSL